MSHEFFRNCSWHVITRKKTEVERASEVDDGGKYIGIHTDVILMQGNWGKRTCTNDV
jgi:hypothetical protein